MPSNRLSPATVKRIHAVIESILGRAVRPKLIQSNPADSTKLDLPRSELPEVQIPDKKAAVSVLDALKSESLKYQVLIHLALCLGCRRGELIALHWSDIDFETGMVKITHGAYKLSGKPEELKDPKNRFSIRTLTIPEYCCKLLTAYHAEQTAGRMKLRTLWQDGANIKAVAAHLGHSQLSTTNRYVHALASADRTLAVGFEKGFGQKTTQHKRGQA